MASQITTRAIPLLDLRRQFDPIRDEVMREVERVIESQRFILGEDVERFERNFAAYCGAAHAIGCASGTDALELAFLALDIGPGDEVLTVPYSFFATAGAILAIGAKPVFVDVEPDTFKSGRGEARTRSGRLGALLKRLNRPLNRAPRLQCYRTL